MWNDFISMYVCVWGGGREEEEEGEEGGGEKKKEKVKEGQKAMNRQR